MITLLCASSVPAQTEILDSTEIPLVPTEALEQALAGIKLTASDISFRNDYTEIDSFRLPVVDSLMRNPVRLVDFADDLADLLFLKRELSLGSLSLFEASDFLSLPDFDADQQLEGSATRVKEFVDSMTSQLTWTEIAFLRDTFPEMLREDVEDEFRSEEELDSLEKLGEELVKRLVPVALKLKQSQYVANLARAAVSFYNRSVHLVDSISAMMQDPLGTAEFEKRIETPSGVIVVGGYGPNRYRGEFVYLIDLGGDDIYELERTDSPQFIHDLSGNDAYIALTDFSIGSGLFYPAFLVDCAGDDIYSGKSFSLGSGLFSVGALVDRGGNDRYIADTHTQGAGSFGLGLLIDESGSDSYQCALYGQAFGCVRGLGALCDLSGNDTYFAGGKYKDILRYKDHYLSLSQGFAYGFRPRMSGGIAILADSSGHDTYISDIFGQGASYWFAVGLQADYTGNDKYMSFQYAQGAATHLTAALLLDKVGDDFYFSKGVSQGCGHDLASGILIDYLGNDTYQAYDLSQGAGSANGFGWLADYRGDDTYQVRVASNTQGYGNPRRDYGSIGLLMDLMGKDSYIGNGSNQSYWMNDSKWGIGMDVDFWSPDTSR